MSCFPDDLAELRVPWSFPTARLQGEGLHICWGSLASQLAVNSYVPAPARARDPGGECREACSMSEGVCEQQEGEPLSLVGWVGWLSMWVP